MSTTTLLVRQDQLATARSRHRETRRSPTGQVRVRIDSFALTANNITYAAFGEAMHYWQFFPTGEEGWGIMPVWGFGTVVQSLHPGVAVGERLYGYWPMASQAVLQPDAADASAASATPRRIAPNCTPSTTSTCAAAPTRSTRRTARTCRRCCGRCSPPRG